MAEQKALFFSHQSALIYWRICHLQGIDAPIPADDVDFSRATLLRSAYDGMYLEGTGLDGPNFHLLAPRICSGNLALGCVPHVHHAPLPKGSFCRVRKNVYVTSPEMTFLHAANYMSLYQLVMLGIELCGTFSQGLVFGDDAPWPTIPMQSGRAMTRQVPLTTPQKIADYLTQCRRLHGVKMARRALQWVNPGAESPMEARMYMRFCLPPLLGGMGYRFEGFNNVVLIDDEVGNSLGQASYRVDMTLSGPKSKIVLEYDGDNDHTSAQAIRRDKLRISDIKYLLPYPVEVVVKEQILEEAQFRRLEMKVRKVTGHRLQYWTHENEVAQRQLREYLNDFSRTQY